MDNTTFTIKVSVNGTAFDLNGTGVTTPGTTPLPATPPPLGYYGETKEILWKIIPPIIMVWGTVGNLLTFLVLLRQRSKLSSTAMYLMALAVSDTVVLYTGPLRQWLKQMFEYDIRYLTDAGCKFQVYITYASLHCSSLLLVAVTLERAMSVAFPHKVRLGCTPKTAGLVIFTIFVFTFGINIVNLVIYGRDAYRSTLKCAPTTKEYLDFRDDVYQWLDFLVAFAIPFILLLAGNIVIIVYLKKSRAKQKIMTAASGQGGSTSGRDTRSVSILMIALCGIFFLTVTPASIFNVYSPYRQDEIFELFKTDPYKAWYDYQFLLFQHAIVNLISYTNASFNFILYVFSGTKFRTELRAMFHCDTVGTSGVFGSNVSKSTSKTGITSISSTRTQLQKDKQIYLGIETKNIRGNEVQAELKPNGVIDSTNKGIRTLCENTGHEGNNSAAATDHTEMVLPENDSLEQSINSENTNVTNKMNNEEENRKRELESKDEQILSEEIMSDQMKRDEHVFTGNERSNVDVETASVKDVKLNVSD